MSKKYVAPTHIILCKYNNAPHCLGIGTKKWCAEQAGKMSASPYYKNIRVVELGKQFKLEITKPKLVEG